MAQVIKVLLVGGTSHVGKSTLADRVATTLGWDLLSTDKLARHPGRPWRDDGSRLPADVVAYYSSASVSELLDSVLGHYRQNVWPIVDALVRSRVNNAYDPCLVLEGSAILPERVRESDFEACRSVWLTASDEVIRRRIRASSRFVSRDVDQKRLIEAFSRRAIAVNEFVTESARRHGLPLLDVGSSDGLPEVLRELRAGRGG